METCWSRRDTTGDCRKETDSKKVALITKEPDGEASATSSGQVDRRKHVILDENQGDEQSLAFKRNANGKALLKNAR